MAGHEGFMSDLEKIVEWTVAHESKVANKLYEYSRKEEEGAKIDQEELANNLYELAVNSFAEKKFGKAFADLDYSQKEAVLKTVINKHEIKELVSRAIGKGKLTRPIVEGFISDYMRTLRPRLQQGHVAYMIDANDEGLLKQMDERFEFGLSRLRLDDDRDKQNAYGTAIGAAYRKLIEKYSQE